MVTKTYLPSYRCDSSDGSDSNECSPSSDSSDSSDNSDNSDIVTLVTVVTIVTVVTEVTKQLFFTNKQKNCQKNFTNKIFHQKNCYPIFSFTNNSFNPKTTCKKKNH